MKTIFSSLFSFYRNIKSKIAFYPSLFALSGLVFAFLMMYLEERGISGYLVENIPVLVVNNGDTALTILSACITGLISMMVFSFSMVMVLLNQASTNYSPRLLPGLISDHKHQIILGIYLSSILYCIFILFSIQPTGDQYQIPGFSVLVGILSTVICIYAFIYFIHTISQSIQITFILDKIYISAKRRMNVLLEREKDAPTVFPDSSGWYSYNNEFSGYFRDIDRENIIEFCKEKGTMIEILPVRGMFALEGIPMFRSKKELNRDEVSQFFTYFHFAREELVSNNYVLAFKQIAEVIAKAMSPGINDPGTALNAIDYLTELLRLRMLKSDHSYICEDQKIFACERAVHFEELLYTLLASIRTYCKHDIVVVQKLGAMFQYLQKQKFKEATYPATLKTEAERLLRDAQEVLDNKSDLDIISEMATRLKIALE
ncbi:DUF2254 domain-containing protein [Salinimicrobium oceani]|uniref:DUF2254 domain-containing protein n=1 Tax=Salinimicrobium oceani TaxID=2722702 RepID=A0ABX1CSW1_9FLAO|nr:DUF2254 domain-containing protein [Salinimicrobium oceani]NJW51393.1 DUF2254 domain-containing protein [Salinimicrobium oceani]